MRSERLGASTISCYISNYSKVPGIFLLYFLETMVLPKGKCNTQQSTKWWYLVVLHLDNQYVGNTNIVNNLDLVFINVYSINPPSVLVRHSLSVKKKHEQRIAPTEEVRILPLHRALQPLECWNQWPAP